MRIAKEYLVVYSCELWVGYAVSWQPRRCGVMGRCVVERGTMTKGYVGRRKW